MTSHKRRPDKVPSGSHPAISSPGKLFCNDPVSLYSLSSHSHKQWGHLGEILGGVRFPESGASRWFVQPPMAWEVVSNRAKQMFMSEATETTKVYVPYYGKLEDGGLCFCAMNQIL